MIHSVQRLVRSLLLPQDVDAPLPSLLLPRRRKGVIRHSHVKAPRHASRGHAHTLAPLTQTLATLYPFTPPHATIPNAETCTGRLRGQGPDELPFIDNPRRHRRRRHH